MYDVFKIIRRKDGVYDLYDGTWWIMSRGCIDDILEYVSNICQCSAIQIVFKDESFEVN